jgi:hypothetical protein
MLCELGSGYRRYAWFPFRAIPNDAGKSLEWHQAFAQVGPFRHLFDGDVIARLPAGAGFEQGARHIYHMRRSGTFIANRRAAARAKVARGARGSVLKLRDVRLSLCNAEAATPATDVRGIRGAVGLPRRRRMVVPSPAGRKIDLNADIATQALTPHGGRNRLRGPGGYGFSQVWASINHLSYCSLLSNAVIAGQDSVCVTNHLEVVLDCASVRLFAMQQGA